MQELRQGGVPIITPQRRPAGVPGRAGYDWRSIILDLNARPAWSVCLVRIPADLPKGGAGYGCHSAAGVIGMKLHVYRVQQELLLLIKMEEVE